MSVTVPLEAPRPVTASITAPRFSLGRPLLIIVAALAAAAFGIAAQWHIWSIAPAYAAANTAATVGLSVAGVAMKRPDYRLTTAGVLWTGQWIGSWDFGPFPLLATLSCMAFYMVGATVFLSYPRELARSRFERIFLFSLYFNLAVSQIFLTFLAEPEWYGFNPSAWWPTGFASQPLFDVAFDVTVVNDSVSTALFLAVLVAHFLRLRSLEQRIVIWLVVGVCGAVAPLGFGGIVSQPAYTELFPTTYVSSRHAAVALLFLSVPMALFAGYVRRRFEHAAIADSIHKSLSAGAPSVEAVTVGMRRALHDDTLEVLYWSPELSRHVDDSGIAAGPVDPDDGRFVRHVSTPDGAPLAAIRGHESLRRYPELVDTAVNAAAMALHNARLQASVRSQLQEVSRSRARIAEAAIEERRRIERDLHDGVQQRLLAIGARLGLARRSVFDPDATAVAIDSATDELRATLTDLRALAHGIHPPELRQFGLGPAVAVVAERLPIDIEISVPDRRFSASVEATAYFIICEALVNVVKHAHASRARLTVGVGGGNVRVEIADNGRGFSEPVLHGGIAGLTDRAAALGGSLTLRNGSGYGAVVEAFLPMHDPVRAD